MFADGLDFCQVDALPERNSRDLEAGVGSLHNRGRVLGGEAVVAPVRSADARADWWTVTERCPDAPDERAMTASAQLVSEESLLEGLAGGFTEKIRSEARLIAIGRYGSGRTEMSRMRMA